MYLLKWLAVAATSPFWFPIVLVIVGFCLLVVGSILIVSLAVSLFVILWLLKVFYVTYGGLIEARQNVIKEIGNELNNISWWRLLRLVLNRYGKQMRDAKQIREESLLKEKEIDINE